MMLRNEVLIAVFVLTILAAPGVLAADGPIVFSDVTAEVGLGKYLERWAVGHGAAWGDADGDGRPDLYIGAFADRALYRGPDAPLPNMLFLNTPKGFILSEDKVIRLDKLRARTTAALFVDLDNDGDMELIASNHANRRSPGSMLFENLGGGRFRDVTPKQEYWPAKLGTRNVTALDMNSDGLLDLIFADGTYGGRRTGPKRQLIVLENKGNFSFELATEKYGLASPQDKDDTGLAIGDVNEDGVFDICTGGSNRLLVSGPGGTYHEVQRGTFVRPRTKGAMACGADFADLNGDGLLDLVTTVHGQPSRIHIYLNKGIRNGDPHFVEITKEAGAGKDFPSKGITGLPVKNAHVDLKDLDNDGRVDIILAVIYKDDRGQMQPVTLRNLGNKDGVPRFTPPPYERVVGYYAPAPVGDYDGDGRVDMFMTPWFEETPSYLFRNISKGGHWLTVRVKGKGPGLNPMGVGSIVRIYKAGSLGQSKHLIARYDIAIGTGYSGGEEALAHLGLGEVTKCDLEVAWGKHRVRKAGVAVDQAITVTVEAK